MHEGQNKERKGTIATVDVGIYNDLNELLQVISQVPTARTSFPMYQQLAITT